MKKESCVRQIKKEYLLYKKTREDMHNEFSNEIKLVLTDNEFHFIDSEILQAIYLKSVEMGVRNAAHFNFNKCEETELASADCCKLDNLKEIKLNEDNWIYVFPSEWQLCGGLLVLQKSFFSNFTKISSLMQDDFDIYDYSLNNSLKCRGDRSDDKLVYFNLISSGEYFNFFTKPIK